MGVLLTPIGRDSEVFGPHSETAPAILGAARAKQALVRWAFDKRLPCQVDDQIDFLGTDIEDRRLSQRMLAAMNDGQSDTSQVILGAVGTVNLVALIQFAAQ